MPVVCRATTILLLLLNLSSGYSIQSIFDDIEYTGQTKAAVWLSRMHEIEDLPRLSWDYFQDLQCWMWPDKYEENEGNADWSWHSLGWGALYVQTNWYSRVMEGMDLLGGRITNHLTGLRLDLERRVHWQTLATWQLVSSLERFLQGHGWSWHSLGWGSLHVLNDWYSRMMENMLFRQGGIANNLTGLTLELERRLHGQSLAVRQIVSSLERFLQDSGSKKPLVLFFVGWTGTGKNHAARIIAENLYRDDLRSLCTKVFIPKVHFPHLYSLEAYKEYVTKKIHEVSSRCANPLFVFDDSDKIPAALLHHVLSRDTQEGRSIFIFLSSRGSSAINQVALNFWLTGHHREEITMDDLDHPVKTSVRQSEDYLLPHRLMTDHLIDAIVPFLPLERCHVKLCAQDVLKAQGLAYTERDLEPVIQQLLFVPKASKIFSANGCKKVAQVIDLVLTQEQP